MGLKTFLNNNSPKNKPELWDNLPQALLRQVAYRFRRRNLSLGNSLSQVVYDEDLKFRVDLQDTPRRAIYLYGCYEYATTKFLDRYLEPSMSFADIGANVGYYTLFAAKRVGASGVVYAFEPVEEIYDELKANINLNSLNNISAHRLAVCDETGSVTFYVSLSRDNRGLSSLQKGQSGSEQISTTVACVRLEEFVLKHGIKTLDLLKVDVEGAELKVFRGAEALLSRRAAPDIIFECHENTGEMEYLMARGYQIYTIGFRPGMGICLYPYGKRPPTELRRSYEPPNYFATKQLKDRLTSLVLK